MGKYCFILLSFLFVCFGCWGHASSENEIKSLLEKAEQSLYSNPVQSAFYYWGITMEVFKLFMKLRK